VNAFVDDSNVHATSGVGQSEFVDNQGTGPQLLMAEPLSMKRRTDIGIRCRKAGHIGPNSIVRPDLIDCPI
jgi:hypothetical protein